MKTRTFFPFLFILCLLPASLWSAAEMPPEYDLNHDGKPQRLEYANWLYFKLKPAPLDVDTDRDRTVTDTELLTWADLYLLDYDRLEQAGTATLQTVATLQPEPEKPKPWSFEPFRLRKDPEGLVKDVKDADPATFGFFRNNLNAEDTWAVEGTLGAVLPLYEAQSSATTGYVLQDIFLVPSATLNRITGTGDGSVEVTDALAFRAGLSATIQGHSDNWFDLHIITANYRSLGSTEGGNFKSAGELDWVPMRNRRGLFPNLNGAFQSLPFDSDEDNGFKYRWVFNGRLEAGESDLQGDFVKVGPKVGIQAYTTYIPRLSVFANYTYLWEVAGGQRDFDYLETGLRWAMDDLDQVFIEAKYRYGQLPAKYSDIDLLQLSLAVKF